ncbi:hypothetical protein MASR1M60_15020 [Rhodocyclaceae bacterium]
MSEDIRYRFLELDRAKANTQSRTVPASLSSEEPVDRFGSAEVLSHDNEAIDLSRAAQGLPLLFSHDKTQPIGIVEGVHIENRRLVGTLRFGNSAKAAEVFRDVQDGILRNVSIGYRVIESEQTPTGWKVTKWGPHEASVVSIPADPSVGINRSFEKENTMQQQTQTQEADIRELVRIAGFETNIADDLVTRNLSLVDARHEIITHLAKRSDDQGVSSRVAKGVDEQGHANPEFRARAMSEALAYRFGGIEPSDAAREFTGMRITDMAKDLLELRGITTRGLSVSQILERSLHTTSDFPNLLLGTGERILRNGYQSYSGGLKRAARETSARDFRAKQALMLSEAPALLKVNEGGEFKRGSMTEAKESYSLETFGRIFSISRQAMVNDDLQAFAEMTGKYGRASAEFEAGYLVDLLASNPTMSDSVALFHADHGNLAGTGTVISVTSLGAATKAMRLQKGLDDTTPIDATPKFLIVPAALEMVALQYLAQVTPDTSANVNPYAGKLELIVDPRLDAKSATAWYLASDPAALAGLEYAYLEGQRGPYVEVRNGFDIDAVEIKARLDFGAGFLDWRGWYKNAGA